MSALATPPRDPRAPLPGPRRTKARDSASSWPLRDRIGLALCWGAGITLTLVAGSVLLYMCFKGITQLRPAMLWTHPSSDVDQSQTGGFLDPIQGTLMLTTIGIAIAVPIGVSVALWLVEYGRPAPLARAVESAVDIIAGSPSVVLALFGLSFFSESFLSWMSFHAEDAAFGRSFMIAGTVMSLIALPLVVGATREALLQVPNHVREASLALGKTKASTIRAVLLPAVRPGIATGTALGMGRIIGDTAIVILLLGNTLTIQPRDGAAPVVGLLQGTGSTLTSYIYGNSPTGEGNAPEKAYAAAFVLLLIVVALNALATRIARGRGKDTAWIR
ncbi:ABC transporter permease subunit [Conexibacter sp. JD483]|uniref:PstA family ABC transporter permease n=1 Tax=unclassified Conexibacter TaxID=2627773 RepID=UPI002718C9BC|nr:MULTISPECIES: ABC transporter permease subunit [unclassified Conexibacter]MDO8185015.1 ABC transporter permease subunit [Conexibacter sp. CPCC 205706]MDO8198159.1 ABC transporter permease subunit [Conexibacter sp. CPCC 205762]MDR9371555.1 ABC transporter permease subunit [Conexibacter sp. JD483]